MTVVSYEQKPYAPKVHFDNYVVTVRPGANADMVADTVRHYEYAAIVLERGLTDTGKEETKTRVTYDLPPNTTEAPVNIFGYVLLKVDDNEYVFSVNKCDHTSTAQEIVDAVWTLYAGLMLGETGGNWNTTPRNSTQQQPQTTYRDEFDTVRRPDGSADLKQTFPRSGGEQSSDPSVPDGVVVEHFDYNNPAQYADGNVHFFGVAGVRNAIKAKKNGSGTYQVIEFLKDNGKPIYDFQVFVPEVEKTDGQYDWKKIKPFVQTYIPNPGDVATGDLIVKIKLNPKNDGGYWFNCNGIDGTVSAADGVDEPNLPPNSEHVPF